MKIVIEFYRTRKTDDMHAILGRETAVAADLDSALGIARRLSQSLAMPQRPDGMTITDAKGVTLHSGAPDAEVMTKSTAAIMSLRNESEQRRNLLGIEVWDNEGGAVGVEHLDRQYGRRIEADRSWTVYHVFTGVPAHTDGRTMTGLSWSGATNAMLSLNRRNEQARSDQDSLSSEPSSRGVGRRIDDNDPAIP